jgi:hypothetical protein
VDRFGAFDDLSEGGFCLPCPPIAGTTGVAQEPRSSKPDSTNTCSPARMISALERQERAAYREDSDMNIFVFFCSDRHCLSMYDLYYVVVIADGEG